MSEPSSFADVQQSKLALRVAIIRAFHTVGIKPLPGTEPAILAKLTELGVTASTTEHGYLELSNSSGPVVLSAACEKIRAACPELFTADPRRDKVTSRQDLERGSIHEIAKAKVEFIRQHGMDAWEKLPQTRAQAEAKAVVPDADMTREDYLRLSRADKAALAGALGPEGISRIMGRRAAK